MKNKILSLVLSFAMVASAFTFSLQPAFAEDDTAPENNAATIEEVQSTGDGTPVEGTTVPPEPATVQPDDSDTQPEPTDVQPADIPSSDVNPEDEGIPEQTTGGSTLTETQESVTDVPSEEVQIQTPSADKVVVKDSEVKNEVVTTDEAKDNNQVDKEKNKSSKTEKNYNTVVFTEAGPFMPAVDVTKYFAAPKKKLLKAAAFSLPAMTKAGKTGADNSDDPQAHNGIETSKSVKANKDGTFTITLEAWTTGKVTTTETTTPADICIVVDQSESMLENLGGTKKSEALKSALHNFIGNVQSKQSNGGSHRISIEGYADNQNYNSRYLHTGWVTVDQAGAKKLNNAVDGMEFIGRNTDIRHGMDGANALMNSKYNPPTDPKKRQKVVIVFTDGYPSTLESYGVQDDFDINISNACVVTANDMKKAGVTIYSVGMFNGANPNELFGTTTDGMGNTCSGKMYESWAHKDKLQSYNPASNRLLNYVSSNVPHHVINTGNDTYDISLGLDYAYTAVGMDNMHRFEIRSILHKKQDGYYLTANDQASLDDVFQTIVENVSTPSIELGKEAVVKDIVTPYFDMPANVKDIKVYTSAYNGTSFEDRNLAKGIDVSMKGRNVEVTGFDYNKNFVSANAKEDGTFGKKLIIEFNVTKRDGFLGGNQVPTNVNTSGVYREGKALENFTVPTVNIPVEKLTVTVPDIHLYLHGSVTKEELKKGASVTYRGTPYDQLEGWQKAYVKDPVVNINGEVVKAESDSVYEAIAVLEPELEKSARADMDPVVFSSSDPATGNIYVYKPEVEFKDLNGYYGDKVPELSKAYVGTQWKHKGKAAVPAEMTGSEPVFTYEYDKEGTVINTIEDIPVNVTVKSGTEDITDKVVFRHKDCNPDCGFNPLTEEFLVHVKTCTLEIKKTVTGGSADGQIFVMDVTGTTRVGNQKLEVTVAENGSTVIKGLPTGSYTVKEQTGNGDTWTWKYNVTYNPGSAELTSKNPERTVVVKNDKTKDKWLNGYAAVENVFEDVAGTVR